MQKDIGPARLLWSLLREDQKPLLLGVICGTAISAVTPQFMRACFGLARWLWNLDHVQRAAATFLIGAVAIAGLLLWLIPASVRWFRSWSVGINRGSFLIPFIAAFVIFQLAGLLSFPAWCVTAILIVMAGIIGLYVSTSKSNKFDHPSQCSDDPRISIKEAWPERRALAEQIAQCIRLEGRPTYAIYGDFGSGKSSMLNFIDEALRSDPHHRPVIVRFNGWLPGSKENLADQLLSDIATECSKNFYVPRLRRTVLKLARTVATSVPHLNSLTEWIPQETQGDIVSDLKSVLARLPKRVVILVDEIDRMRKDELAVFLKLIRGFSSLPQLSFVCAMERRQVERLIKEEFGEIDHTFYHKFFADSYQIPRLVDSFLKSETHDALTEIFETHGWFSFTKEARVEYSAAIEQYWSLIFSPLCTNVREVHRLASTFRSEARPLVDEVNPVDLTLVCVLRCFAPAALELMWRFHETLCALDLDTSVTEPESLFEATISLYLERERALPIDPLLLEQVQRIRAVLFAGVDEIRDAQESDSNRKVTVMAKYFERNKVAAQTRSLRSMSYFPAYFQSVLPVGVFPEKELQRIFDELSRSDEFQVGHVATREIRKLDANPDKRLNFLEKLSARVVSALDLQRCMWLANVVVGLAGGLDNLHCETEYRLIDRLVTNVADELFLSQQSDKRLRLLQICILGARADGVAHRILSSAVGNRPMPDGPIAASRGIENVPREHLEKVFLERMTNRYGPSVHPEHIDLNFSHYLAFHDWGILLEKSVWATDRDQQHNFWMWYISSPERMAQFTRYALSPFFVGPSQGNPNLSLENILRKEDISNLAMKFPPYEDSLALSTLRELLGSDVLPEPIRMRTTAQLKNESLNLQHENS